MTKAIELIRDLPPGPYSYRIDTSKPERPWNGHVYVMDATGKPIASILGTPAVKQALTTLLIEARALLP